MWYVVPDEPALGSFLVLPKALKSLALSPDEEQHLHLMDVREAKSRIDRVDGYRCKQRVF